MSPIQVAQISALLGFKTFDQLSEEQQKRALKKEMDAILNFLCESDPDNFYGH